LSEVILSDSIERIGEGCFYNCYNLQKITLPNNIVEIPSKCFSDCFIKEITNFPYDDEIAKDAFRGWLYIPKPIIPKNEDEMRTMDKLKELGIVSKKGYLRKGKQLGKGQFGSVYESLNEKYVLKEITAGISYYKKMKQYNIDPKTLKLCSRPIYSINRIDVSKRKDGSLWQVNDINNNKCIFNTYYEVLIGAITLFNSLARVHERGIFHNDVYNMNIFIQKEKTKLSMADFGEIIRNNSYSSDIYNTIFSYRLFLSGCKFNGNLGGALFGKPIEVAGIGVELLEAHKKIDQGIKEFIKRFSEEDQAIIRDIVDVLNNSMSVSSYKIKDKLFEVAKKHNVRLPKKIELELNRHADKEVREKLEKDFACIEGYAGKDFKEELDGIAAKVGA
jgi:hypothetical protein